MSQYPELYNHKRWRGKHGLQARQLRMYPLCWYCDQVGEVTAADTVDHVIPHHGDPVLFFDVNNLRSTCKPCHDGVAARKDSIGYAPGVTTDGTPVDEAHPWNR